MYEKVCEYLREHAMKIILKRKNVIINKRAPGIIWKSVIFVKKNLKINIWKIKKYCKVRDHCHYTGEYRGAPHCIFNLI